MTGNWARRVLGSLVILGMFAATPAAHAAAAPTPQRSIIVQMTSSDFLSSVTGTIARFGGSVDRRLPLIDGFSATVPAAVVPVITALPGVRAVTANTPIRLLSHDDSDGRDGDHDSDEGNGEGGDATASDTDSWVTMASAIDGVGASAYFADGLTGQGIDVALVDSGVSLVPGLDPAGKVIDGPDFSSETNDPALAHRDLFGHGTHMAGIIAGADQRHDTGFSGLAPGARLVNVKVADAFGRTDVSQVIAGIGWVVMHRNEHGMHIRVLNLSFGTDGGADPNLDPLDQAVERAWRVGLTVVVAAGNRGTTAGHLANPARDPLVLAVGAADSLGNRQPSDDIAVDFSSHGDGSRNPDVVAPGRSIVSLRSPGSFIDDTHTSARVGDRFFRGSGTSQAAAITSGAVALVLQQHSEATPDQVKSLLNGTAIMLSKGGDATAQGHGLLDLATALRTDLPAAATPSPHVGPDGHPLTLGSEGSTWHISVFAGTAEMSIDIIHARTASAVHTNEVSGDWDGSSWSGSSWSDGSWSGNSWSDDSW